MVPSFIKSAICKYFFLVMRHDYELTDQLSFAISLAYDVNLN